MCRRTGIVLRQGHLERGELNVKGSGIAPPSDSGPDAVISARAATVDLHRNAAAASHFDELSLNWGWLSSAFLFAFSLPHPIDGMLTVIVV